MRDSASLPAMDKPSSVKWSNTFGDIREGAWYYDAVAQTCEDGWFAGDGLGNFLPGETLTRGMTVTMLARMARYDGYTADGGIFDDIPADKWFAPAAEWAYERGIASGTGDKLFSPYSAITREETALFLYRLAQYKGYRTDGVPDTALERFPDADEVSDWAREAVAWAVHNKLISGMKKDAGIFLSPKSGASRAESAQMAAAFDRADFTMLANDGESSPVTVGGTDISEFVIIRGSESQDSTAAAELSKYIALTAGVTLPVYTDTEKAAQEHEILIGKTNREAEWGAPDRSGVTVEGYTTVTKDGKLLISGGSKNGTLYGVYAFLEKHLGWVFAWNDCEARKYAQSIDIPDGICLTENSPIDLLAWFESGSGTWRNKVRLCGDRVDSDDGYQCTIPYLLDGNMDNHKNVNPCYSDEALIQRLTDAVITRMEKYPDHRNFNFGCYDNCFYCTCDKCLRVYREEGSRAGTYVRMINRVAAAVAEKFPQNTLLLMAYDFTTDAPKSDLAPNINVRYITITMCFHHTLDDPDCPLNVYAYKNILSWREKCQGRFYIGDHGNTFEQLLIPVMNFEYLYTNLGIYNDLGFSGFMYWGNWNTSGEFSELRSYLIAHLLWDGDMSRDEYQIMMETYLRTYYGAAWHNILDYIDDMTKIQDPVHFNSHSTASGTVDKALLLDDMDRLDALWETALVSTRDDAEANAHVERSLVSYLFIRQNIAWDTLYDKGDERSREVYVQNNGRLFDIISEYRICWNEANPSPNKIDYTKPPEYWS